MVMQCLHAGQSRKDAYVSLFAVRILQRQIDREVSVLESLFLIVLSEKKICCAQTRWYAHYLAITERIPPGWTVSKRDIDSGVYTLEDENSVVFRTVLTSLLRSLSKYLYGISLPNKDPSLEYYVDIMSLQILLSILIGQFSVKILDHFASLTVDPRCS